MKVAKIKESLYFDMTVSNTLERKSLRNLKNRFLLLKLWIIDNKIYLKQRPRFGRDEVLEGTVIDLGP